MKKKKNSRGFTLIELLAVIIILGILMIIAIPSVTSYINNSRKSAYVDTAREIISGARNLVNEGKLEMFDTGTTYYIPVSCVSTENGQKSPYGDFVEDQAFVVVTYTGNNYNYFWISRDTTGQGVKTITPVGELDEDDIKSDIIASEITPTEPAETGKNTIKVLSKDDCKTFGEGSGESFGNASQTAASQILTIAQSSGEVVSIGDSNYIFKGGNPANYVKFNNEDWRIIGIYGDRLKIQKVGAPAGLNAIHFSTSLGVSEWSDSSLKSYLNETYYNSLNSVSKNMIDNGTWNVGHIEYEPTAIESYLNSKTLTDTCKVGLIASYEFLYASSVSGCENVGGCSSFRETCGKQENNWLTPSSESWTLSRWIDVDDYFFEINPVGFTQPLMEIDGIFDDYNGFLNVSALPVVFLKSSVTIASGDGTSTSTAYVLEYSE